MIYQKMVLLAALTLIGSTSNGQITPISQAQNPNTAHYTPWKPIAEKDIVRKVRMLEEISAETNSELFNPKAQGTPLINVLIEGEANGKLSMFAPSDGGHMMHRLTHEEFAAEVAKAKLGKMPINKYILKQDSCFINTGEAALRIVSIAPVCSITTADGTIKEEPLFWAYYFDARSLFAQCHATQTLSWDDVLVGRHFYGKIVSSINNVFGPAATPTSGKSGAKPVDH